MSDFAQPLDSPLPTASPILSQIMEMVPLLSVSDLGILQTHLEAINPIVNVDEIDLGTEIALQLRTYKSILAETRSNPLIPANQKIAAANGLNKAIANLMVLQQDAYNIERTKSLEQAVLVTLKGHPDGASLIAAFQTTYENLLGRKIDARVEDSSTGRAG